MILLGFGSVRSRVCLWSPENAQEGRAGSVVSLPGSSEEEPGLLKQEAALATSIIIIGAVSCDSIAGFRWMYQGQLPQCLSPAQGASSKLICAHLIH